MNSSTSSFDLTRRERHYWIALLATLCVAFGIVWMWVAFFPLAYLDPEYPAWLAKQQMLARCDLGDLLVVGDSRAAVDVIPSALPMRTTNLAVGGGSPIEAYVVVSRALTCPSPPHRFLVSFNAAHFTEPDLFWERSVRFGLITADDLRELRRASRQLKDRTVLDLRSDGLPPSLRSELYMLRFPSLYFGSLAKGGVFLRWRLNQQSLSEVTASRGQYFFGTDSGSSTVSIEGYMQSFTPLPVLDHYFDQMLSLLAQRGIEVDIVAMPINDATDKEVRADVREKFAAYIASYAARYSNVRLSGDAMPHWPDRWFGDNFSHLNRAGAQRFSAALATWLSSTAGRSAEHTERSAELVVQ
jgi:hypothetical protein